MLVYSDLSPKTAASKNITTPILKYARSIFLSGSQRRKKKTPKEPGALDFRNLMVGFQMWLRVCLPANAITT